MSLRSIRSFIRCSKFRNAAIIAVVISLPLNAYAESCRVMEYGELKDMTTLELRNLGSKYYGYRFSTEADIRMKTIVRAKVELAILKAEELTCTEEIERIVSQLRRRKDLDHSLKTQSGTGLFQLEFLESYEFKR